MSTADHQAPSQQVEVLGQHADAWHLFPTNWLPVG
jgi:hypothetical protein